GPHALGLLIAGHFVLLIRGLLIRRNPLTMVAVSIPAAAIMHIVVVTFFTIRQPYSPLPNFGPASELGGRLLGALLTSGSALALSVILLPLGPSLGLHHPHARRR